LATALKNFYKNMWAIIEENAGNNKRSLTQY